MLSLQDIGNIRTLEPLMVAGGLEEIARRVENRSFMRIGLKLGWGEESDRIQG